jgi:hypothetical protein
VCRENKGKLHVVVNSRIGTNEWLASRCSCFISQDRVHGYPSDGRMGATLIRFCFFEEESEYCTYRKSKPADSYSVSKCEVSTEYHSFFL